MGFGGVREVKCGVRRRGNRTEAVAVLRSEHIWMCVKEIRKASSWIMYVCGNFDKGILLECDKE